MKQSFSGFTLIELIVVIGIFSMLLLVSLPFTLNSIVSAQLNRERDTLIPLLQSARDQSYANLRGRDTGVKINSSNYTLFEGTTYASRDTSHDIVYPRSEQLFASGTEFRFRAPDGVPTIVSGGVSKSSYSENFVDPKTGRNFTLSINQEGMIDW
ncbi:MAG TPA: type II secretion system protein [Patescibacteria group bacterium]